MNPRQQFNLNFSPQPGPQTAFVNSPFDITVFGGARGGGKTYASLGSFFLRAQDHGQDARGLIVRRTREALRDTVGVAERMYHGAAKWIDKGQHFRFDNGARLFAAYLDSEQDAQNYQGWGLTDVLVEELTQWASPAPVFRLFGAMRSAAGIRAQMRATCNPGGPGHLWVKEWVIDNGPYNPVTDPDTNLTRVFIPSRITDNPALSVADPAYVDRLKAVGSPELVRAWLEGDWDVLEGAFFPEFKKATHVITPFPVPGHWTRFMAGDWGSAKPFAFLWFAVVQDDTVHDGRTLPRGALVAYREYYGCKPGSPDTGLKLTAEHVAKEIVARETDLRGNRERVAYRVLDPAAWNVVSGPSIGETFGRNGVPMRKADNTRKAFGRRLSGWDQVRNRLIGEDGVPRVYFMENCRAIIRTLPLMQHDERDLEDVDTAAEDHAVDALRYACMSRPYLAHIEHIEDKNPFLIRNAMKLDELD